MEYFTRIGVVFGLLTSVGLALGTLALLPTYLDLHNTISHLTVETAHMSADAGESKTLAVEVKEADRILVLMERKLNSIRVASLIDNILAARPEGVSIDGLSYDRKADALFVSGVAAERRLLVSYTEALEALDQFVRVPLPVSDLAQQTNTPFRLRVEIAENNEHL
jgi:hypothetical protein